MRLSPLDDSAFRHVDNRYYDGPHYDQRYLTYTHDVAFWCALAESSGTSVLELAVGTGRLSIPIAQRGIEVVGIDISPAMLAAAINKATAHPKATFLMGDMRDFDLDRQFDLVILACSSACHLLTDDDAVRCFISVARHLQPSGRFAMDLVTPSRESAIADGAWRRRFGYADPNGGGQVAVYGRRRYDPVSRILTDDLDYRFEADGRAERATRISRMYPVGELRRLLALAGFEVREIAGGFSREVFTETSPTQVIISSMT
jgi:SAM-dependent methyltransferase